MGWFAKTLYASIKDMDRDLTAFKVKVAEDYTPTTRFESAVKGLSDKLDRILDKMDGKADK